MAMSLEEKYAILSKHIKTAAGRQKIAASIN